MKNPFKPMSFAVIIVFFGGMLSTIGALLTAREQSDESAKNSNLYKQIAESAQKNEAKAEENNKLYRQLNEKTGEIARIQAENDSLIIRASKDQIQKTEEITRLSLELAEKADTQTKKTEQVANLSFKLAEAQEKLIQAQHRLDTVSSQSLNYLTGGNSWCYVELLGEENGKINVHLQHVGNYPLSALRILITRTSAAWREVNGQPIDFKHVMRSGKHSTMIPVGPLPKPVGLNSYTYGIMSAIIYGSVPFESNVNESYSILFMAQNGYWTQEYSISRDQHNSRRVTYEVKRGTEVLLRSPQ